MEQLQNYLGSKITKDCNSKLYIINKISRGKSKAFKNKNHLFTTNSHIGLNIRKNFLNIYE